MLNDHEEPAKRCRSGQGTLKFFSSIRFHLPACLQLSLNMVYPREFATLLSNPIAYGVYFSLRTPKDLPRDTSPDFYFIVPWYAVILRYFFVQPFPTQLFVVFLLFFFFLSMTRFFLYDSHYDLYVISNRNRFHWRFFSVFYVFRFGVFFVMYWREFNLFSIFSRKTKKKKKIQFFECIMTGKKKNLIYERTFLRWRY